MAVALRRGLPVSGSYYATGMENKRGLVAPSDVRKKELKATQPTVREQSVSDGWSLKSYSLPSLQARPSTFVPRPLRWWEKNMKANMTEVMSAQDLVDSLLNAGDKLVIVDFYSPGCGGCRALHPKICQLAELHPDAQFLMVNHEENKSWCYTLRIHVLPFFRFYRGAQGRLCAFSCTTATIKKFKDALAKHGTDCSSSVGPTKGLEVAELMILASAGEINYRDDFSSSEDENGVDSTGFTRSFVEGEEVGEMSIMLQGINAYH